MFDKFSVKERVEVFAHDADGNLIASATPYEDASILEKILGKFGLKKFTHDYITDIGLQHVITYLYTNFTYVGIGTDGTGSTDTTRIALGTSVYNQAADTVEYVTTVITNDTYRLTTTFTVDGTYTFAETGVFNVTPLMLARQTFTGIPLVSGNTITIVWTIQFTR